MTWVAGVVGEQQELSQHSVVAPADAPTIESISIVVPVRDNPRGIERLLRWWSGLDKSARAREMIIVDDASKEPVRIVAEGVRLLRARSRGPAAARNLGWRSARGAWVAFTDSDCVPDEKWPAAFASGWSGEVAMQGRVRALGSDLLSRFYESQEVLRPMAWDEGRPQYIISANALVHREALASVGGFDERFSLAAGEDVELGIRLRRFGPLRWTPEASIGHDFEPSASSFLRRFYRYGRGNRMLARVTDGTGKLFAPRLFAPKSRRVRDLPLAFAAYAALSIGWAVGSGRRPGCARAQP